MDSNVCSTTVEVLSGLVGLDLAADRCEHLAQFFAVFMEDADQLKSVNLDGIEPPSLFRSKEGEA